MTKQRFTQVLVAFWEVPRHRVDINLSILYYGVTSRSSLTFTVDIFILRTKWERTHSAYIS